MSSEVAVVGAVILEGGRVLCAQRSFTKSQPGMWEFPGGKIEVGESPKEALAREIREELGCEIAVGRLITTVTHHYEFGAVRLSTYYCSIIGGELTPSEHKQIRWLSREELALLDWAAADLPTVAALQA